MAWGFGGDGMELRKGVLCPKIVGNGPKAFFEGFVFNISLVKRSV